MDTTVAKLQILDTMCNQGSGSNGAASLVGVIND
jgi:hypothetical protein